MAVITLDFETYYDSVFSLSKMTTEEYIRSPMFECIMVSVKVDNAPTRWFSGTRQDTYAWLMQFDWANAIAVAHNAAFDMSILAWHFGIKPKFIADTMSMARGLVGFDTGVSLKTLSEYYNLPTRKGDAVHNMLGVHRNQISPAALQAYAEYCCNDTELCFELFKKLYPLITKSELRLIDWTIRIFSEPQLVLDGVLLAQELAAYQKRSRHLLAECGVTDIAILRSDGDFARLLMQCGVAPPTKQNAANITKWAFARTDIEFMDLLEDPDEHVVALVEARLGSKSSIVESRIRRLLDISTRGALPFPLSYCGAMANKRWSAWDNINLQNLPRNKIDKATNSIIKSPLRAAIRAPQGKKLMVADLSQIELRINCWQAGQNDVLDLLRKGGDSYADMASTIYGYLIDKPMGKSTHTLQRFVGKTTVLGCGYQCGGPKFQHMLKVAARRDGFVLPDESLDYAKQIVDVYRKKNAAIVNFWKLADDALAAMASGVSHQLGPYMISDHKLWLPGGTYLYYPDLRMGTNPETGYNEWTYKRMRGRAMTRSHLYGGKFTENITSAVARIVMSDAMLKIMPVVSIVGTVHDELIMLFNDGDNEEALIRFITSCMTQEPSWAPGIPLACEVSTGFSYAEAK